MFVTTSYQLWQLIGREMRERGFFKRTGFPDADWLSDTAGEGERVREQLERVKLFAELSCSLLPRVTEYAHPTTL
jgi:hypothetical protein